MRRRLSALVLVILGLTVGGCTVGKDGHTYVDGNCVTCLNNPLTGQAMNYEKTSPDYVAGKNYAAEQRRIRHSATVSNNERCARCVDYQSNGEKI